MKNFDYIKPGTMDEAISALKEFDDAFLLAGGTDLLVGVKNNLVKPKCILDLKGIPNLDSIEHENGFKFGPLITIREIETSKILREKTPFLCQAASTLGSVQIRNRATLGGNLCNASPAGDMATMFLAMNSEVTIATSENEKTIGMEKFFTGPKSTVLSNRDILTEITVPEDIEQFKGIYMKYGPRKAMDIGIVNVAVLLDADFKSGLCKRIRIALGAVAPTPMRAGKAEDLLKGNVLKTNLINDAAEAASNETDPITDFRASAGYRKELVKTLVSRGINSILESNQVL
jgi:carbon-monoxide dehydrogenase medium subunit